MITSVLLSERSAGATVIAIYDDDKLVYAHQYFKKGTTHNEFVRGCKECFDNMVNASDYEDWEGNIDVTNYNFNGLEPMLSFRDNEWSIVGSRCDKQTAEFVGVNYDKLPTLVTNWSEV
jgi:hypothetical protein